MMMMPPCPMFRNAQEFKFQQWYNPAPPYVFSMEPPLVATCLFTMFFFVAKNPWIGNAPYQPPPKPCSN
jgi:hypothetical protein